MKNAFITGCNRGLGLHLLKSFASRKYNIIACVRREEKEFLQTCQKIESEHDIRITPLYMDLAREDALREGMDKIRSMNLKIDVLINNAAICRIRPLLLTEYEDMKQAFVTNYFAPFQLIKTISALMIDQGHGTIVNISSAGSLGHQPGGASYDASKAALNQLTISAAQELAAFNIRVNAVAPGPMQTEMFESLDEKAQKKLLKNTAFKRPATLDEISKTILFLCSDDASYITGQIISIDGGSIL